MAIQCIQDDGVPWSARHCAVWIEEMAGEDGAPQFVMLRHPNHPYRVLVPNDEGALASELRKAARSYLELVSQRPGTTAALAQVLPNLGVTFDWLDLSWGAGVHGTPTRDPRGSFWMQRLDGASATVDRTAVLLAGARNSKGRSLAGEIGLRVVMHVSKAPPDQLQIRVTGMSVSNLPNQEVIARIAEMSITDLSGLFSVLQAHFGFADPPAILGVAPGPANKSLRLFGAGSRGPLERRRSYAFVSDVYEDNSPAWKVRTIAQIERLSHADVFARDPASSGPPQTLMKRRPTRPADGPRGLDSLRLTTERLPPEGTNNLGNPTGLIPLAEDRFKVLQTRIGSDGGEPEKEQEVPVDRLRLRSDELAAAHAFTRGRELCDRLDAYALAPTEYFKFAKLPLLLRHRAPIRGAGDGKTVNAQVRPVGDGISIFDPWSPPNDERPSLEVRFGAAALAHTSLQPSGVSRRKRAQPLGLAADPRWAWHEFGHVLGFASTGALEFRFAHSAGDALAAIVADSDSELRSAGQRRGDVGGATFPWVSLPRRHDRDVDANWCWCGRRNVARQARATAVADRRLGYFQEQLLSSALFRLYRCIGGDTFADQGVRRSASDYTVYLIMRAIALLGPDGQVPTRSADQFVSALIDADIGTEAWDITANWPESEPQRTVSRVGGCVHKVVRWAFERQGLYATDVPLEVKEGPGKPPPVDIYIEDDRGGAPGGYRPVALGPLASNPRPWHASAQAIDVSQGRVTVRVGNRGQIEAKKVRVTASWSPVTSALDWKALDQAPSAPPTQDVARDGSVPFRFRAPLDGAGNPVQPPYWIRASASCVADRSNADPASWLPCTWLAPSLVDLIANDNNQGLRLIQAI